MSDISPCLRVSMVLGPIFLHITFGICKVLKHSVFTDGDFELRDPVLLIDNGRERIFQTYRCIGMVPTVTD